MIVVSDTSPVTNLLQIGDLDLLKRLFGEIVIPEEVYAELCEIEDHAAIPSKIEWIKIVNPTDPTIKIELSKKLDKGEAEAIALAIELQADYLLMDETKGRAIAENYNIKVTGILGILLQAKQKGFIAEVKPHLQKLVNEAGFWLNPKLIEKILELAKEN